MLKTKNKMRAFMILKNFISNKAARQKTSNLANLPEVD